MSFYAIIAGIGPGTGRAAALRFSQSYTTILLARNSTSYDPILAEIHSLGGRAFGIPTDVSSPASLDAAFSQIPSHLPPDAKLAAAVFNASAGMSVTPFLDADLATLQSSLATSAQGLFCFAQRAIPGLLDAVPSSPHPPSLIVTGATASLRGSARFATFAAGKFAQRAITQSLAREFGPRGVHVALVVIDGAIGSDGDEGRLNPRAIADSYWHLHTQHPSAFTQELDLRPNVEKF